MSAFKQLARPLTTVILLGITVLGLINVYGDNGDVKTLALRVACGGKECPTQLTRLERNPISQTYDIVAETEGAKKGSVTVTVKCSRQKILIGDWECTAQK
ncbi:MAG TPA: hypothetical protein VIV60_36290 [Polyangiaceae bacterium]